jgi:hypothetical protein
MKLHYFWNGKCYLLYDQNYNKLSGYLYTLNQVRYYAMKRGWDGVKKVNYDFVDKAFRIAESRHQYAQRLP